jgi:hypothetical protein
MTFMVSHNSDVYEKDLGPDTAQAAAAINVFNPDKSWDKADMTPLFIPSLLTARASFACHYSSGLNRRSVFSIKRSLKGRVAHSDGSSCVD